ncbi:MAG: hypothetical protein AAFQ58_13160 [Pseudomonadota bacterium]
MATEIRHISFSNLRRHGRHELKFVYEHLGHLWLTFHGKPRAVIIPMRDEEILHAACGMNPDMALHRARVDFDRRVDAIERREALLSKPVTTIERGYPPPGLTDAEHDKTYDPNGWGSDPRAEMARRVRAEYDLD